MNVAEQLVPSTERSHPAEPTIYPRDAWRWIVDQRPDAPISSNIASSELPFQRWFHFKEAFSPRFVAETIASLPYEVRRCLDPFAGSGTTPLTCRMLGISSASIEINPFLADLIIAKLTPISPSRFRADYEQLIDSLVIQPRDYLVPAGMPKTMAEPGDKGRYIFSKCVFSTCRAIVRQAANLSPSHERLLKVLLGRVLVENSNVTINGKGRRYRKNWEARRKTSEDLISSLDRAVNDAVSDLVRFAGLPRGLHRVFNDDARRQLRRLRKADAVIFSPPYPNSFDYTDVYNIELWMLGYLSDACDNRTLRKNTLRSHVQVQWTKQQPIAASTQLRNVVNELTNRDADLWDKNIPKMIQYYFDDLYKIFRSIANILPASHHVVVAIGDSQYAGVHIDVATILQESVASLGFEAVQRRAIRSMRNSSQHGGQFALSEHCMIFERVR